MAKAQRILITGPARSGTTMLLLMMQYFKRVYCFVKEEAHPLTSIVDSMYNVYCKDYQYICFKQPYGYYEEFPPKYLFSDLFEKDWKIISLMRDPRDVFVSKHLLNPTKYWVDPIIWKRTAEQILLNINNPNLLVIRYEDLVTSSDKIINVIEAFLKIKCDGNYKDFFKTEAASYEKNNSLNGARPISNSSIGNWKKPEHAQRIKETITPDIIKLGRLFKYDL